MTNIYWGFPPADFRQWVFYFIFETGDREPAEKTRKNVQDKMKPPPPPGRKILKTTPHRKVNGHSPNSTAGDREITYEQQNVLRVFDLPKVSMDHYSKRLRRCRRPVSIP